MSRIGRMPITVPAGVEVKVDGQVITVKGPKGTVSRTIHNGIGIEQDGNVLHITRPNDEAEWRALHGLTRTLIHNMVVGVSDGFKKELEINGVGYRAAKEGKKLVLNVGYSHQVFFEDTDTIKIDVPAPTRSSSTASTSRKSDSSRPMFARPVPPSLTKARASSTSMK